MDNIKFFGYLSWYRDVNDNLDTIVYPNRSDYHVRNWLLERLPYELSMYDSFIASRDIGEHIEGSWSSFYSVIDHHTHYFFQFETDAMIFKLKWF